MSITHPEDWEDNPEMPEISVQVEEMSDNSMWNYKFSDPDEQEAWIRTDSAAKLDNLR